MAYVGQGSRFFARQCSTGRAWEALSFRGRVRGDVEREPLGKRALGGRVSAKIRLIDTACSSHILAKFHRVIFRTPPPTHQKPIFGASMTMGICVNSWIYCAPR